MTSAKPKSVGLIWAQFAAYHVDRCEATARRLAPRAEVLAIEVATTSVDYAWEPSGAIQGARKVTLFPGQSFDAVAKWRRFAAMFRATRRCDVVCIGLSYGLVDVILLSWCLRLMGKQVVVFSESKFDDCQRSVWLELFKSVILSCYSAAIVGGKRHLDYFRFLGFRRRSVLPGYDVVGVERIRQQARSAGREPVTFGQRPFLFVGRFVDKKNLFTLLRGYAAYVGMAGPAPRRLVLAGSGADEPGLRQLARDLAIDHLLDLPGFLSADAVSRALADAAALVLVSREEQWGLVVNEALAVGLPVIVSDEVGSRDLLVRTLVNGFVVPSNAPDALARAMLHVGADEQSWLDLSAQSTQRAWMGDTDRLADAVELLLFPEDAAGADRIRQITQELETPST